MDVPVSSPGRLLDIMDIKVQGNNSNSSNSSSGSRTSGLQQGGQVCLDEDLTPWFYCEAACRRLCLMSTMLMLH
jgi:hypothetical protein